MPPLTLTTRRQDWTLYKARNQAISSRVSAYNSRHLGFLTLRMLRYAHLPPEHLAQYANNISDASGHIKDSDIKKAVASKR